MSQLIYTIVNMGQLGEGLESQGSDIQRNQ